MAYLPKSSDPYNQNSSDSSESRLDPYSQSKSRLQGIAAHMSQPSVTAFPPAAVPQAPEDPLFGLMAAFKADTFDKKVDLGIGAYRDNDAKPWVLPVVKKVCGSRSPHLHIEHHYADETFVLSQRRMRS